MKKLTLTILGWIISAGLIFGLAARLDWHTTWDVFTTSNIWLILAAACLNIIVVVVKTVRWQLIMYTKRRTHFWRLFKAMMIGLAGNNVLPARGGDWYRIYLLGKWERISHAALASMTGLDKLFDGIAILAIFSAVSLQSTLPEWVRRSTLVVTGVVVGSLIVCILLRIHHRRNVNTPLDKMGKLRALVYHLGAGMSILEEKGRFGITLVLSLVIAVMQIATLALVQHAFNITAPLWVPVLVFVAINLAITVPSAPSNIGPFEVAAVLAYTWLGFTKEMAFNAALMYHIVQVIPVTAIGAYYYVTTFRHGAPKEVQHGSIAGDAIDD